MFDAEHGIDMDRACPNSVKGYPNRLKNHEIYRLVSFLVNSNGIQPNPKVSPILMEITLSGRKFNTESEF